LLNSLTDLAGLRVGAEEFLAAVLGAVGQPVWVVDHDGVIRFANPAAIAALGYDSADELFGRHSHETIHHSHPDGTPYPAADCPMLLPRTTGETISSDLDWFFRRDGSMFPVSYVSVPIEMPEGRGAVVAFTNAEDRVRGEQLRHENEAILAAQRRVATLVAGGAASTDVFAAVAREAARVLGVAIVAIFRYGADETVGVLGAWSDHAQPFQPGTHWPLEGLSTLAEILRAARPVRIDDFGDFSGPIVAAVRAIGVSSGAYAPIVVDGDPWGVIGVSPAPGQPLPEGLEERLVEFTELAATAISNTASREQVARLADEQAALRRVATLVARGVSPHEVFAAVAREVGELLGVDATHMGRYEHDGTATGVASWMRDGARVPPNTRRAVEGDGVTGMVLRTGRPARRDSYDGVSDQVAVMRSALGIRSSVGAPIVVDQDLWGVMIVSSKDHEPLPAETESRIAAFTELVATAISNTEARSELAASRARIVAAADEERRGVVRDLHDGAQQRLIQTVITLKLASRALEEQQQAAPELVSEALEQAEQATAELRELAHGILPSALTRGGLRTGIDALASRTAVPVDIAVSVGRLPPAVEATAYFVVAEALTNVAKHARAEHAAVSATVDDGSLQVQVRDDGVGGAHAGGSGLLGLLDRLAAIDGRLEIESPPEGGTLVVARIPLGG
jgi:PAS domain S-box-containing protein